MQAAAFSRRLPDSSSEALCGFKHLRQVIKMGQRSTGRLCSWESPFLSIRGIRTYQKGRRLGAKLSWCHASVRGTTRTGPCSSTGLLRKQYIHPHIFIAHVNSLPSRASSSIHWRLAIAMRGSSSKSNLHRSETGAWTEGRLLFLCTLLYCNTDSQHDTAHEGCLHPHRDATGPA